jgi:hypothetical protein
MNRTQPLPNPAQAWTTFSLSLSFSFSFSFRFVLFCSFCFISFRLVLFRFVSFLFAFFRVCCVKCPHFPLRPSLSPWSPANFFDITLVSPGLGQSLASHLSQCIDSPTNDLPLFPTPTPFLSPLSLLLPKKPLNLPFPSM